MALAQGPGHHQLVPSQYMGGGPSIKGFKGCGLAVGRIEAYLGFLLRLLLGKCFARMAFYPKEVSVGWSQLMHAIRVGIKKASNPYPLMVRQKQRGEKQNKEFCLGMKSGAANTL